MSRGPRFAKWKRRLVAKFGWLPRERFMAILYKRTEERRAAYKLKTEVRMARGHLIWRTREGKLVANYIRLCIKFMQDNGKIPNQNERRQLKRDAIEGSGYKQLARGPKVLGLARIQQAIENAMNDAGATIEASAAVLAEIMHNQGNSAGDRLRSVELRHKLTTGFAPAKSAKLHGHMRVDQLFDAKIFAETPDALPVSGQDDE